MTRRLLSTVAVVSVIATGAVSGAAVADGFVEGRIVTGGHQGDFLLSCENGRTYPLRPRAVSDWGDLVTGSLITGPNRSIHVRLVPMGVGYRYAGRGIWIDGARDRAFLYFGKDQAVACTVSHD
jgi:hypothetical protein